MKDLTNQKLTKLLELTIPDAISEDQKYCIYELFDKDIRILQAFEDDSYLLERKIDQTKLTETEILVWIREKQKIPIEHVPSKNGVKSTNFVQDLHIDTRKIPKEVKLPLSKTIEIANAAMQETHALLQNMSDEQILEYLTKLDAAAEYCRKHLATKNIQIKDRMIHNLKQEQEQKKLKKAEKAAAADKPKIPLTKEQKAMKAMGRDYNNPEDVKAYREFIASLSEVE